MIGDTLKRVRNIYGFKATELSHLLDISTSYLSEIENNKKKPSFELLEKYSSVFDIKLSSLILLCENIDEAEKRGKGDLLIRNMMQRLITHMSKDLEVTDDEQSPEKEI